MRILTARVRDITIDRGRRRMSATIHLVVVVDDVERAVAVRTSAPIQAPGGARLKDRLIASAKLMLAMQTDECSPVEAELVRPAA